MGMEHENKNGKKIGKVYTMKEKKIIIVRCYSGYGGVEHQIENIIQCLNKKGWKTYVFTDVKSPFSDKCEIYGANVIVQSFNSMVKTALKIRKICKEENIRIIQSHMLKESFICRITKLISPSIVHIFRIHTYIDCSHISRLKKNIYHFASWITGFAVNEYVSINQYNVNELLKRTHVSKKKIQVVHNAVRIKEIAQTDYNINEIAMIANFVDFKGHDVLVRGMAEMRKRGYHLVAHLFGTVPGAGTEKENIARLEIIKRDIEEYDLKDSVIIHGYSRDIVKDTEKCGILVLPSDSEGTPNVVLEGMMMRKLIVASDVGGVPEFIIEGKTGFLHKPKSPKAFADALEKAYHLSNEEKQKVLDNAVGIVKREYSIENMINGLLLIYNSYI